MLIRSQRGGNPSSLTDKQSVSMVSWELRARATSCLLTCYDVTHVRAMTCSFAALNDGLTTGTRLSMKSVLRIDQVQHVFIMTNGKTDINPRNFEVG